MQENQVLILPQSNNSIEPDPFTECWATDANNNIGFANLSLQKQINALTSPVSKLGINKSPELTEWQNCLSRLLQENNRIIDRGDVQRYVKATQDVLRNPSNTAAFQKMLDELSEKAKNVELLKIVLEKAALFLIAVIIGVLLALTASTPVIFLVIAGVIAFFAANFYDSETPEGRLSEGISCVLGKMGFFKPKETHEVANDLNNLLKADKQTGVASTETPILD